MMNLSGAHLARTQRARTTRLGCEQLEDRSLTAGLTATLTNGVLTVAGTSDADSIVLKQASGLVSITGVSGTFAAASIQSVVVNGGAGNDVVTLNQLVAPTWNKPVSVTSSGGDDVIRLPDGRTVYVAGNTTVAVNSTGAATVNGKAAGWFDFNIHDAALRQLLKTDFADSAVNRTEMLAVFRQVQQDGTVTTNEFSDLKAVATNTSLFGSFSYVADLTRDVVLGSTANLHYQGTTLGNLAANSSATQLGKLVGKWFLGADHPVAKYGNTTFTYTAAAGHLFSASGPQYSDVHQGALGDCYFVATLGEIALRTPAAITSMFIVNGDGTYSVRLYGSGQAHYVTVDGQLPVDGSGRFVFANMGQLANSSTNVLWVALAEKAYVQMNEAGWLRSTAMGGGQNAYQAIAAGLFSDVVPQVTNRVATNAYIPTGSINPTTFQQKVSSSQLIGLATTSSPTDSRLVGNHQYIVVGYNATTKTVTLFNPWGLNNGSNKPGLVDLSLTQLVGNFSYWTTT